MKRKRYQKGPFIYAYTTSKFGEGRKVDIVLLCYASLFIWHLAAQLSRVIYCNMEPCVDY